MIERTNLIDVYESILYLFRHTKFKPENIHLWCKAAETFCCGIVNSGVGWPKAVANKTYWKMCLVAIINAKYFNLISNTRQKLLEQYINQYLIC